MHRLGEADVRAIVCLAGPLIGRAGRTSLAMALRGSRAKRVLQFGVDKEHGDATWLPLLHAWSAAETRRARSRLAPVIAALAAQAHHI